MQNLVIILVLVLAGVVIVWLRRARRNPERTPLIDLTIALEKPMELDPETLESKFSELWGETVECNEAEDDAGDATDLRQYVVSGRTDSCLVLVSDAPMPEGLTEYLSLVNPAMTDSQRESLAKHQATVIVLYLYGSHHHIEQVRFTARLLQAMIQVLPATGCFNRSARAYFPVERLDELMVDKSQDRSFLFAMFTTIHLVDERRFTWMHTHGMEQFGLEDLEIKYRGEDTKSYYHDILTNLAIYMIQCEPKVKLGDTGEMIGDGVIYKFKAPSGESKRHFGRFGGLEIVRK